MIEIDNKLFITSLNEVAATDSGKVVLAYLKDDCHWDTTIYDSTNPQVSHFHAVKRGIYGGLRMFIRAEYLKDIEFNFRRKKNNDGSSSNDSPTKPSTFSPTSRRNASPRASQ